MLCKRIRKRLEGLLTASSESGFKPSCTILFIAFNNLRRQAPNHGSHSIAQVFKFLLKKVNFVIIFTRRCPAELTLWQRIMLEKGRVKVLKYEWVSTKSPLLYCCGQYAHFNNGTYYDNRLKCLFTYFSHPNLPKNTTTFMTFFRRIGAIIKKMLST